MAQPYSYDITCCIDGNRHVLRRWGMTPDDAKKVLLHDYKHAIITISLICQCRKEDA